MTLCRTFRKLSSDVWSQLERWRRVEHQLLEETLTDLHCLELKDRHPNEVFTRTFTKPQEGINGADWEWWFANTSKSLWLGVRVQAKVLNLSTNRFEHLHYRDKQGKSQLEKLRESAKKEKILPLYCFYLHSLSEDLPWKRHLRRPPFWCLPSAPEQFGCCVAGISSVEKLRQQKERDHLEDISEYAVPWHCLVCSDFWTDESLPERVWAFLWREVLELRSNDASVSNYRPREEVPAYVRAVIEGEIFEPPDPDLRRITVFIESE
jgi:hypothetical protein